MKRKNLLLLVSAVLLLLFTASLALAAPIGKVTQVAGKVDVLKPGKNLATSVKLGDPVDVGDIYRAKTKSNAEITFNNQNILKIAPATRVEIKEYMVDEQKSSQVMKLHRGRVQAISGQDFIKKVAAFAEGNRFEVHTPNAVAGIRGSNMLVGFTQGTTVVIFIVGQGYLYNPQMPQLVIPVVAGLMSFVVGEQNAPSVPTKASEVLIKGGGAGFMQATPEAKEEAKEEGAPPPTAEAPKIVEASINAALSEMAAPVEIIAKEKATEVTPPPPPTESFTVIDPVPPKITPPPITATGVPTGATNKNEATIILTNMETGAKYEYSTDGGITWIPTTGIISMTDLSEGLQNLQIKATDTSGNVITKTYSWTTDYTPPAIAIPTKPASLTNASTATFGFSATDATSVTYKYSTDGGTTWVDTGSTLALPGLSEGDHTIQVQAIDAAGNVSTTTSYSWTVDLTPPASLTLTGTPPSVTGSNTADIGATATDAHAITYSYTLDDAPSSGILTDLSEGTHTLTVTATDAAGNTSTTSYKWFIGNRQYIILEGTAGGDLTGAVLSSSEGIRVISTLPEGSSTGAWLIDMRGSGTPSSTINLTAGGKAYGPNDSARFDGYWLSSIDASAISGSITGNSDFTYLSLKSLGKGTGSVTGIYSGSTWQAQDLNLGTYTETPLMFSGSWNPPGSLYYNASGIFTHAGDDYGLWGGLTQPWTSPASFLAIGEYSLSESGQPHYLMNSFISGGTPETDDNASIDGYAGAIWKGGSATTVGSISDGTVRALYISTPDATTGNVTAGIMKGTFAGNYYDISPTLMWGMWGISGTLTPTPVSTGLIPANLPDIGGSMLNGRLSGSFGGEGSITGWDDGSGRTMYLYNSSTFQSLPFGIFNIKFGKSGYPNYYYDKPTGNPAWSAKLGGIGGFDNYSDGYWLTDVSTGTWTDTGEITGNVTGKALTSLRLYDMEGRFTGVNQADTWIGQAIGSYTGTDLKFFSWFYGYMLDAVYSGDPGYLGFDDMSTLMGKLGGTTSLWSGSNIPVTIIGSVGPSCLWYTYSPVYSYNMYTDQYTTYDSGAYFGLAGGSEYANVLAGKFIALYIDNSATPKAGVLQANLSGYSYPMIYMFEMAGLANRTEKSVNIGIPASELYNNTYQGYLDGTGAYLYGKFNNNAVISGGEDINYPGSTYAIYNEPWGIYGLPLLGTFETLGSTPTSWTAKVGSYGTFGAYKHEDGEIISDSGYWLADITGTVPAGATTTEGKLLGTLTGKYLTSTRLGTMDGDVYGTYGSSSYWKAVALGTWTGTPLTSSLTFSKTDATPTKLWRALTGDYYEAEFVQRDIETNREYYYEYEYITTSFRGYGTVEDDYNYIEKIYFPNGNMWKDQDGMISMGGWEGIGSIDAVKNLPDWMKPSTNLTFTPVWYSEGQGFLEVLEERTSDTLDARLGMTGYPWNTGGTPVTVIGKYTADGSDYTKPTIITTPPLFGKFYTPYVEGGTANGAYVVNLGGFITDDARGVQLTMRGLYTDGTTAGVLRHSPFLTGSLYKDIGMWDAEGTLIATVMKSDFTNLLNNPAEVTIDNFSTMIGNGPLVSEFGGRFTSDSGSFIGTMVNSGGTHFIKGQDWGTFTSTIWAGGFSISTGDTIPDTWSTQVIGEGQFGAYMDASGTPQPDIGMMFIPELTGTLSGGVVKAPPAGTGQFMTMTKMGTISDVGVLGVYTQPSPVTAKTLYSWQGVSGGVWNTTQYFTFASDFGGSVNRFTENHSGGYFDTGGETDYYQYYYWYNNESKEGYADISFFSDPDRTYITQRKYEKDSDPFATPMWYEYKYDRAGTNPNTFSDYKTDTYDPSSTVFSHEFFSALAEAKGYPAANQPYDWWGFYGMGSISAIMGGVGDLWTATSSSPATVYFLGDYDNGYGKPINFGAEIESYNIKNDTDTTLDGKGAYYGYIGGHEIDGAIGGGIRAIYLKDDDGQSEAGILLGSFEGKAYNDAEMWQGHGTIYPVYLMNKTIPYADIMSNTYVTDLNSWSGATASLVVNNDNTPEHFDYAIHYMALYDETAGSFGVWRSGIGAYGIDPDTSWTASFEYIDPTRIIGKGIAGTTSSNVLTGSVIGYGADLNPSVPATWVSVGNVKGTFDPTLFAFQIGAIGVSIETNTYLSLAATDEGRAKLQQLGIPAVQVGMADLKGSYGNVDMTGSYGMNGVKFFSATNGGKPQVWATNNVSGAYSSTPVGVTVPLSGGGLTADFAIQQMNAANKWLATVKNGSGALTGGGNPTTYTGSIQFKGAGAGTYTGTATSGTFSGTAAGIAK